MQVTKVSASIRYSRDLAGAWKSIELGVEAELSHGDDWWQAQSELYTELGKQLRDLWPNGNGTKHPGNGHQIDAQPSSDAAPVTAAREHYCETHQVAFTHRQKDGESWWSHKIKGTSEWCTEAQ